MEFVGAKGSFRNTTVGGQINGQGLDLGVIDDPIKGRAEAQSKVTRDKTWSVGSRMISSDASAITLAS